MKKILLTILILGLSLFCFANGAKEEMNIRRDTIDALVASLKEVHPNLYSKVSEEEFNAKVKSLKQNMYLYDDLDFALSLSELTALVGDSHTSIKFGAVVQQSSLIPLGLDSFKDGFHAIVLPKEYAEHIGKKVIKINGYTIDECLDKFATIISADNKTWLVRQAMDMFTYSSLMEFVGISDKAESCVAVEFETGEVINISKLTMDELATVELERAVPAKKGLTAKKKAYYSYVQDDDIIYIQYNSCRQNPEYPFSAMVDEISKLNFKAIVVDLRNNGGGSDGVIGPLFEYLSENKYPVYCLIGDNTFSSAVINTAELDAWFDAVLVGSPTGGSANHFGSVHSEYLPNDLGLTISTKVIDLDAFMEGNTNYGWNSINPDYLIEESFEDYINGVDSAYNFIKEELVK